MTDNTIESTIAEAVKAKVQIMLVQAMGNPGDMIGTIVATVLQSKVSVNYREVTILQKLCQDTISKVAKETLEQFIRDNTKELQAEIMKQLTAKKKDIAEALVGAALSSAGDHYRTSITFGKVQ